ncbi:MAG TPA: hypothetical protein VJI46_00410 [Candidatus Nanoarchaeia archaeon]|nr:hypothetical protein [Candidatus Nanoarchaeia archaeon]
MKDIGTEVKELKLMCGLLIVLAITISVISIVFIIELIGAQKLFIDATYTAIGIGYLLYSIFLIILSIGVIKFNRTAYHLMKFLAFVYLLILIPLQVIYNFIDNSWGIKAISNIGLPLVIFILILSSLSKKRIKRLFFTKRSRP